MGRVKTLVNGCSLPSNSSPCPFPLDSTQYGSTGTQHNPNHEHYGEHLEYQYLSVLLYFEVPSST